MTRTHAELLNLWKTYPSRYLGLKVGARSKAVAMWRKRGTVPPNHVWEFAQVVRADFGLNVTAADLRNATDHRRWLRLYQPFKHLAKGMDVEVPTAKWWKERGRIPPSYWPQFIDLVKSTFGIEVTMAEMAEAYRATQRREEKPAPTVKKRIFNCAFKRTPEQGIIFLPPRAVPTDHPFRAQLRAWISPSSAYDIAAIEFRSWGGGFGTDTDAQTTLEASHWRHLDMEAFDAALNYLLRNHRDEIADAAETLEADITAAREAA